MPEHISRGDVYWVNDRKLELETKKRRKGARRTFHTGPRPVIVISGDSVNQDDTWSIVQIIPTSTKGNLSTDYCLKLPTNNPLKKESWAVVPTSQPLLKGLLGKRAGAISEDEMIELEDRLLSFLGFNDRVSELEPFSVDVSDLMKELAPNPDATVDVPSSFDMGDELTA